MRDLHLTSPPMHGPRVLAVQRKLHVLGYTVGPTDGRYGRLTAAAVSAFQKAHRLRVDGVVGTKTAAALAAAKPAAPAKKPTPKRPTVTHGQLALAEARRHIGVVESPRGTNRNPFGKWFGVNGVPWCAIFVSYCFKHAAGVTICKGFKSAGCYPNGCTYVPTVEAWLRRSGHWIGKATPRPGDIAIFNWDGGVADHIGIVERYVGAGRFVSIEGNTALGNDSNGGEVMRRDRHVSQVNGFGRI